MLKHKLYSESSLSPHLNSSMESAVDKSVSLPLTSVAREFEEIITEKFDKGKHNFDGHHENSTKSDNDDEDDNDFEGEFLKTFLEKRPYSFNEDVEILKFVLKDQNIYRVSSVLLWKYLESKKKNPKRTYQSLKNRFLRNIKPKLFTTYKHLINDQDQIKKILDKFPELKKDLKKRTPLTGLNIPPRKVNNKVLQKNALNVKESENSAVNQTLTHVQTGSNIEKESGIRIVKLSNNSVVITVPSKLVTNIPSSYDSIGIYQKYLDCSSKNKLKPCPTCGRFWGPELNEVQDSENENDFIILNSVESDVKSSQCSKKSKTRSREVLVKDDVGNKRRRNDPSPESSVTNSGSPNLLDSNKSLNKAKVETRSNESAVQNKKSSAQTKESAVKNKESTARTTDSAVRSKESAACSKESAVQNKKSSVQAKESAVQNKKSSVQAKESAVKNKESTARSTDSAIRSKESAASSKESAVQNKKSVKIKESAACSKDSAVGRKESPTCSKESALQKKESAARNKESTTKITSSSASEEKYSTSAGKHSNDSTDEELQALYQETVMECETLLNSEGEEEALVKKCFEKNCRSIGFDSYVLLNKLNLDSFFAVTESPLLDSLDTDPAQLTETKSDESPLIENMKRMLRPRNMKQF